MLTPTLIVPYYRNPHMLVEQVREWVDYPEQFEIVLVDDGSPEKAIDVLERMQKTIDGDVLFKRLMDMADDGRFKLFRINVDIPWNRGGARNLGTYVATTDWVIHVDIDHLLPAGCAKNLLSESVTEQFWYRFPRFRRGKADETRRKDAIPDNVDFGSIHPHIDSYLCSRRLFWRTGGYDEDYSGCLGGGSPFLRRLEQKAPVKLLSKNTFLCVYTRSVCDDASDNTLSRDTSEFSRRRKAKEVAGNTKPKNPLRFPWHRVL